MYASEIKYRDAVMSDLDDLASLDRDIFGVDAYSKNIIHNLIIFSDYFKVALINDKIIGYICGEIILNKGHVISIAVKREYRGLGVGSRLLNGFIDYAKNNGADRVYLEVSVKRFDAIKFYRKFGFKVVSKISKYYNDGSDAYIMELRIK